MRILVCGGRNYARRDIVFNTLDSMRPTLIIEGGANGADALACEYAARRRLPVITVPADWKHLGRRAGPIRNQKMLDEHKPDRVVAFPGGDGTADMVARARKAGVDVWTVIEPIVSPSDE